MQKKRSEQFYELVLSFFKWPIYCEQYLQNQPLYLFLLRTEMTYQRQICKFMETMNFRKRIIFCLFLQIILLTCFLPLGVDSVLASPHGVVQIQPDGSDTPQLFIRGDHRKNYITDEAGYSVMEDEDGWHVYADSSGFEWFPTSHVVGLEDPQELGLKKRIWHEEVTSSRKLNIFAEEDESTVSQQTASNENKDARLRGASSTGRQPRSFFQNMFDSESNSSSKNPSSQQDTTGRVLKNLVVLMRFKDHEGRGLPSEEEIDILMNHEGPIPGKLPTGSVADVYNTNSFGNLLLESDVLPWVTISQTEEECADGKNGYSGKLVLCIHEALEAHAKNGQKFSQWDEDKDGEFDGIMILHSGHASEWGFYDCHGSHYKDRIWSHKWSVPNDLNWDSPHPEDDVSFVKYHVASALWGTCGTEISRIGAIAHETGHFMNLPDLYDTDQSGYGSGNYDMMANMWGWENDQYNPPIMSCWTKAQQEWIETTDLNESGIYNLPSAAENPVCYKITKGFPENEYLLVENRHASSYDINIPGGGGLAVWHIDEDAEYDDEGYPEQGDFPSNGRHYRVSLLQADGEYALEKGLNRGDYGDLFREGDELCPTGSLPNTESYQYGRIQNTGVHIYDISAPGPVMNFKVSFDGEIVEKSIEDNEPTESSLSENDVNEKDVNEKDANDNSSPTNNVVEETDDTPKSAVDLLIEELLNENKENANLPKDTNCKDDPDFFFSNKQENCVWVGKNTDLRCGKCRGDTCIIDYCPETCGTCL